MALENFLGISNEKLITSFAETLYMVGISLIIATVIAFILAVVLIFTRKGGLYPNAVVYNIINVIITSGCNNAGDKIYYRNKNRPYRCNRTAHGECDTASHKII